VDQEAKGWVSTFDLAVAPNKVLFCQSKDQVFKILVDGWSSTFVFSFVGPFEVNELFVTNEELSKVETVG